MDELVIMALVAVGLHVVIDIVLMCKNAYRQRKDKKKIKEDGHCGNNDKTDT